MFPGASTMQQTGNLYAGGWLVGTLLGSSLLLTHASSTPSRATEAHDLEGLFALLDRDGDGIVSPYEGAEAFLWLAGEADSDGDGGLRAAEVETFLAERYAEDQEERLETLAELDNDGDGALVDAEVPGELWALLSGADSDGDGAISESELLAADLDDPSAFFEAEILAFFDEVDRDGDGAFALSDLPAPEQVEFQGEFERLDADQDGRLTRAELLVLVEEETRGAVFEAHGHLAEMHGVIGPSTPGRVLELALEHPEVETIVLADVPGSMDDEANLRAARLVRRIGYSTHVPSEGEVASGGTDFFLAGRGRSAGEGARFGVHSWSGMDGEEGAELPRDHPEHAKYLDYYRAMGVPEAFYWFTLESAPPDDIHWMSTEELEHYGFLNQEHLSFDDRELAGLIDLASIPVRDGELAAPTAEESEDVRRVRAVWGEFLALLPSGARRPLQQIRAVRLFDGQDVPGGFASPIDDDPHGDWEVALALDPLEEEGLWVLAHEYAHVLSLGDPELELVPDGAHDDPRGPRYGAFVEKYWRETNLIEPLREINPEASVDPQIETRFIEWVKRESGCAAEFVSEPAMVSPEEDFAETFAAYVLGEVPAGNRPIEGGGTEKLTWFASTYPRD